ncbi:MAG: L,D-transpeptidase family protein [Piscirickettsiaceae bacterium]|nr:L,D-transpeptidase family protein [Piscirickettsiaceae bacterium]
MVKKLNVIICILISLYLPVHAAEQQWLPLSQQYDIDSDALAGFFKNKQPSLWLDKQQFTSHAHDALDFIAASIHHGLNPDDYHFSVLRQLDPTTGESTAQQFDFLLTDGLLKLIHDIAVGRLDSSSVDPQWFIPKETFNASDFLHQALLSSHLKTELNSLAPHSNEYVKIATAITRYQTYINQGGWGAIPETPLLRLNDTHPNIPAIQARLAFEDKYLAVTHRVKSSLFDPLMEQSIRRFQQKYGLKVDGIFGSETRHAMNIPARERLQQIKITLERYRWMPSDLGQRYLIVNIANYTLHAIENGATKLSMRVIVGTKNRPTPSFTSKMDHLVYNPYWNIPRKLARLDLLPKQQENSNYFYLQDIRVFTIDDGQKFEHDPYDIDWGLITRQNFSYTLRQDPGDQNALGKLKFKFSNRWDIFLHDTPHKELFNETNRSLSSGCIRVEDPIALANFSLVENNPQQSVLDIIASHENRGQKLSNPLSIYAVYFTVWLDGNEVRFSPDVYGRDARIAELL